jgi:hypothetical protein
LSMPSRQGDRLIAPTKGRIRQQLLQELNMSAIKVAATATSRADPGKVFGLLKDPVTWPRWSMFESASSVAMVRDARRRAPHHEDPHSEERPLGRVSKDEAIEQAIALHARIPPLPP